MNITNSLCIAKRKFSIERHAAHPNINRALEGKALGILSIQNKSEISTRPFPDTLFCSTKVNLSSSIYQLWVPSFIDVPPIPHTVVLIRLGRGARDNVGNVYLAIFDLLADRHDVLGDRVTSPFEQIFRLNTNSRFELVNVGLTDSTSMATSWKRSCSHSSDHLQSGKPSCAIVLMLKFFQIRKGNCK